MLGRSANAPLPPPPTVDRPKPPEPIDALDRDSEAAHPESSAGFPYRVQVMVGDEERKAVFRGNTMFVPLRKGEVYWIRIENREAAAVLLRLLVDGRNTLPERVKTKGVTVEPIAEQELELPAQRVNLAEARYWQLDPNAVYGIQGFYSKLGEEGAYHEFAVADAPSLSAQRERFSDQLGIITAAFYAPKGDDWPSQSRGLMTEPGKEQKQKVRICDAVDVGKLLAVVNIHYVEPQFSAPSLGR
jgi:hypothetical protein